MWRKLIGISFYLLNILQKTYTMVYTMLRLLITNPSLDFENSNSESNISTSKMADKNLQKVSKLDENRYIEVFEVTDYETIIRFVKFKIADPVILLQYDSKYC